MQNEYNNFPPTTDLKCLFTTFKLFNFRLTFSKIATFQFVLTEKSESAEKQIAAEEDVEVSNKMFWHYLLKC